MNRRQLLLGCVIFPFLDLRIKKPDEPELADPIPPGYKETLRCNVKGKEHVIFSKQERLLGGRIIRRWRLYIDGKFDYEGVEK